MDSLTGRTIRDYELQERIGEGGYGAVYRAYEASVKRDVAVKVILSVHANKPEFAQRFENEAQLVARLEHPHIVPLYRYWRDEDGAFLVMRYIKGGSLRDVLRRQGALSLAQITRLLDQMSDALAVAHQSGVIHRDLKPDNILLDERGNAYLTDFGIAKQVDQAEHITGTDAIVGTFAYLAPEQIQGQPVSPQTDLYALGIMLYELLSGAHPYKDTPAAMMVVKHLQEPLPSICEIRPDLSSEVDAVIQKATAKDPSARYSNALDVMEAFRATVNLTLGTPVIVQSPVVTPRTPSQQPATPEQRNRANMLQNVQRFWIEGVLDNSLHGAALIELGMKQSSGTIDHAWDTLLRKPGAADQTLPRGTEILDMFDKLNGKLLILGDPGGGKTTTLLELARDLLFRAEADDAHPIPVIFNLSSWSESHKPLVEWLVDELSSKYQAPKKVAQTWVESDALLLLLDGLDEVSATQREACVQAINTYRGEHGFVDVVVCSRIADYEALTNRLKLNGAIVIQSLDDAQVDRYLSSFGGEMETVRRMLANDLTFHELAHTPLILSIIALAYRGASSGDLPKMDTPESQRQHIFEMYVRRMFERRVGEKPYTQEQTTHYLSWLARKMQEHAQSVFQIENLQPTWLTPAQRQGYYWRYIFVFILQTAFVITAIGYLLATVVGLIPWLTGLLVGSGGLLGYWVFASGRHQNMPLLFLASAAGAMGWGLAASVTYGPTSGLITALLVSIVYSASNYNDAKILGRLGSNPNNIVPVERLRFSWSQANPQSVLAGIANSATVLIVIILITGLKVSLIQTIIAVLAAGIVRVPQELHKSGLGGTGIELKTRPNQGIWDSAINSSTIALATGVNVILSMIVGFTVLGYFTIGVSAGLALGFSAINSVALVFGWQTVLQHFTLRRALSHDDAIPQNYARFLDYAAALIFLRKVGGGYIFVHRYLLEYFAGLEP